MLKMVDFFFDSRVDDCEIVVSIYNYMNGEDLWHKKMSTFDNITFLVQWFN